ncbi:MAG: tetratricopeptide repeat protein [Saprospiraceae bacterium]
MENAPRSKNIVYGDITAGGNVHIGDNIYVLERDFQHSVLFLRIEPAEEEKGYQLQLTVKSEHARGLDLLHESVQVNQPPELFTLTAQIQQRRRHTDGLRHLPGEGATLETREDALAALLHQTFFSGDTGAVCGDFIALLQKRKIEELLLVIASGDEQVRNLPFEMVLPRLFGSSGNLALSTFGLVRSAEAHIGDFNLQGAFQAGAAPLKMLFITALPENLGERGKMLEVEEEQRKLIEAVGHLEATGDSRPKIAIEWLDNASLEEIDQALQQRRHDIVHISGHGAFHEAVKRGVLYLEDADGNERQCTGRELGERIKYHQSVKLVVLSACETAVAGAEGTADDLAATGIPAVLAMRFSVTDEGARIFTTEFYRQLALGATLTQSLAAARQSLWHDVQEKRRTAPQVQHLAEWFTPVLYQNQYTGPLIDPRKPYALPEQFYPKSAFLKGKHTRLIGQGFIGRKTYLIRLRQHFRQGQHVCIHGLGGLGKTTLAEAFAHNYDNQSHQVLIFRNGNQIEEKYIIDQLLLRFKALQPAAYLLAQIEEAVNSPQVPPLEKLQYLIDNYLAGRKIILIFDNFEDVQVSEEGALQREIAAPALRDFLLYLLDKAPAGCHVLFTTRYKIAGLEMVRHLPVDKLSYAEQWRYMRYSGVFRDKFSMTDFEAVHRRLDGHPRALEYLEGLVRMDPAFNWQELDQSLGKVEERIFQNLLPEKIWERLDAGLQDLFTTASVFFSRSPLPALAALTGQAEAALLPGLEALRDWSLCFYENENARFEVHALTREWMRRQGRPDAAAHKALCKQAGDFFRKQPTWDDDILAREYFEAAEAWEDFAEISFGLAGHFRTAGFYKKVWDFNHAILEKNIDEKTNARSLNYLGLVLLDTGDYDTALRYLEQSLAISKQIGDRKGEGATLNNISQIYSVRGDHDTALRYLEQSLAIQQQIGNRSGEGTTLNNISQIYRVRGDYGTALRYLEQSLAISKQIGDRSGEGNTLNNLATTAYDKGDYDTALRYLEQSLAILQQIGNRSGEGITLNNLATTAYAKGDYDTALRYWEQSLAIQQQIGGREGEGTTLNNISQIYRVRGDHDTALRYLEQSLAILQQIGDIAGMAATLNNMGGICFDREQFEEAIPYFLQSYSILQKTGSPNLKYPANHLGNIMEKIGEKRFREIISKLNF